MDSKFSPMPNLEMKNIEFSNYAGYTKLETE
jgi:hypothetical protein